MGPQDEIPNEWRVRAGYGVVLPLLSYPVPIPRWWRWRHPLLWRRIKRQLREMEAKRE